MECGLKIIDNFLDNEQFNALKTILITTMLPEFPWYFYPTKVKGYNFDIEDYQFSHVFYHNHVIQSNHWNYIVPLLQKIDPIALIRVKANLNPNTKNLKVFDYHVDVDNFLFGKTAIFYVNSNDGYTVLENGTKIDSVENRIAIFNSNVKHAGTSCTNEKVRCVININFVMSGENLL